MIKVMVVIYGLVMFVPTVETVNGVQRTELTAIFVDGGDHVHAEHEPIVRWAVGAKELGEPWDLPTDEDFLITVSNTIAGGVDLDARPKFSQLQTLFTHPERAWVEPGCLEPNGSCKKNGDDLTQGHATFTGKWKTAEATYCCGLPLPVGDHDDGIFEFRKTVRGNAHGGFGRAELGTALSMTAEVQSLDDVAVHWDGPQSLYRLDETACKAWFGTTSGVTSCAVLVMGNPPSSHGECKGEECRLDRHFSALYRLAEDPPIRSNRWFPYLLDSEACPVPDVDRDDHCLAISKNLAEASFRTPKKTNMPSVRCPPAFGQVEPETVAEPE